MTKRYIIPNEDHAHMRAFAYEIVEQLKSDRSLETKGVILACGEIEVVIGDFGAEVFNDESIVDDLCLHMTPIIYESLGYLAPNLNYTSVSDIHRGTGLCRIINVRGDIRNPLYAINMIPVNFEGHWRDIDMSRPSSISPTFELMGIKPNQYFEFKGDILNLDNLDLSTINMLEFSRLGSLLEVVRRKPRVNSISPDPLVERFITMISDYQNDLKLFIRLMMLGRRMFALAFWIFLMVKENELILGNLTPGIVDRFVEAMGVSAEQRAIQLLEVSHYHRESPSLQNSQPYFDHHHVLPFFIEWKESVRDAVLCRGCENIRSPI